MRRDAMLDVGFVSGLLVVYVLVEAVGTPKRWVFVGMAGLLTAYAWVVWKRHRESPRDFGLRLDNLAECAGPVMAWTALVGVGIVVWSVATGRSPWRGDLAILIPLYPVYGVAQQLLFQGVFHRRLMTLISSRAVAAGLTSLAFALVHLGDWRLVGLTALAGAAWSAMFQRWPNVWVIGTSHGILAALTYPLILGDRPLARI